MQLVSVNIGQERAIQGAKENGKTGIYKLPVTTPVQVTRLGLESDAICDTENHGGVDQALYLYGAVDYAWWSECLQQNILPGTFGENLTLSDMESTDYLVGDRFHVGTVILEVTGPRIPCITLARRMEDNTFVKQFLDAERPGVYCRVIQEGTVQVGDSVTYERHTGATISVLEALRNFVSPDFSEPTLRRFLAAPIAMRYRTYLEDQLREKHGKEP